jgi:flagellar protein FliO/FliZ
MAQTPTPVAAQAITPAPVIATNSLNMAWGILFLLALVGAAYWLIRRSGGLQLHSGRGMKMVAGLQVGPRERVVLIEMAGQQWLLGVAPGNVNLLQHFEQPIVQTGLQNKGGDDFASKIRAVLQQGANR